MELLAKTCKSERMNMQRLFARIFVALGGVFWLTMVLGADIGYRDATFQEAATNGLVPAVAVVVLLAVGWFYENLAAAILLAGT
ncbi:MAG: hypothetical protein Q8K89_06090, partial [Actinomycetota bacterium]|nr:hypothetical protein [Actinomycetota bacterium]